MRTMSHGLSGETLLMVHTELDPLDSEWEQMVEEAGNKGYLRALVLSNGGAPNAKQRARLSKLVERGMSKSPTAILTRSTLQRAIMTAIAWLGLNVRSFTPDDVEAAMEFLEIDRADRARTLDTLLDIKAKMLGFESLSAFAKARSLEPDRARTVLLDEPFHRTRQARAES